MSKIQKIFVQTKEFFRSTFKKIFSKKDKEEDEQPLLQNQQ